ncbi:fascin domain-containing protein [Paraburkholderia sp.]|uniref:fascin domain-containing protein n=1 Tax=Paraburkholderia sp. TaxID=1926495 RepID=UPI003D6F7F41
MNNFSSVTRDWIQLFVSHLNLLQNYLLRNFHGNFTSHHLKGDAATAILTAIEAPLLSGAWPPRANSLYVTAGNAGSRPLIANRASVGPWQTFDLIVQPNSDSALAFRLLQRTHGDLFPPCFMGFFAFFRKFFASTRTHHV